MHEMAIVINMISVLEKEVSGKDVGDVKTVHLEVGRNRYVVPEIMNSCFKAAPKGSKLHNAELKMDIVPGKGFIIKGVEW